MVYSTNQKNTFPIIIESYDNDDDSIYIDSWTTVAPETVGQFTGMTDKNGTRIFEGDIMSFGICKRLMYVHFNEETLTWELTDVEVSACEVNHLYNTFDLGEIQVEAAYDEMVSEVVGNVYDNPELWDRRTKGE